MALLRGFVIQRLVDGLTERLALREPVPAPIACEPIAPHFGFDLRRQVDKLEVVEPRLQMIEPLCIRRAIKSRKTGKEQWLEPDVSLYRVIHDVKTRLITDEEELLETKLRTLVPETLFDAFYFKGEPLDGKLLGGVSAIRQSLATFLHEDRWEEAEDAAEGVRQGYTRELEKLTEKSDLDILRELLEQHRQYTASPVADNILKNWSTSLNKFHKVMPIEYKKALANMARASEEAQHG